MIYPSGEAGTDVSVFKVAASTVTPGNYMLIEAPGFENYRTEYMVGDSFNMEDGRVAVLARHPYNSYMIQANPIQKMTAGSGISITSDGTISASGGTGGSFSPADQLQYNLTGFTPTNSTGNTYWDADAGTLATVLDSTAGVVLQHGQELLLACTNKTAASIPDGTVVYIDGAQGNHPTCAPAKADDIGTCQIIGMTTQAIAVNATGFVTLAGHVHGFDTSIFASTGMTLYLSASTAGGVTTTAPSSPNFVVIVGRNLNQTNNGVVMITASRPLAADTALSANSNIVAPSQAAVKSYIGTKVKGATTASGTVFTPDVTSTGTFNYTLTGNATINNPTGMVDGDNITILVIQDSTGGRIVTWGSAFRFMGGGYQATTTASGVSIVSAVYQASSGKWLAASATESTGASDKSYTHSQASSSATWSVAHGLGKFPSISVVDSANTTVVGKVSYTDLNNLTITFNAAFTGTAYCN